MFSQQWLQVPGITASYLRKLFHPPPKIVTLSYSDEEDTTFKKIHYIGSRPS